VGGANLAAPPGDRKAPEKSFEVRISMGKDMANELMGMKIIRRAAERRAGRRVEMARIREPSGRAPGGRGSHPERQAARDNAPHHQEHVRERVSGDGVTDATAKPGGQSVGHAGHATGGDLAVEEPEQQRRSYDREAEALRVGNCLEVVRGQSAQEIAAKGEFLH
jgi:hypothetical protein